MEAATERPRMTPTLARLIEAVREAIAGEPDNATAAHEVAARLRPYLGDPELLLEEQAAPSPDGYCQHILHVEPDGSFSIVALVWEPGQVTAIHDHVSWCVAGVHGGNETETCYRLVRAEDGARPYLVRTGEAVNEPGACSALAPPGDIHRVGNEGPGKAISIHIYGADIRRLGSSIRRCYDYEVRPMDAVA